MNDKYILVTGSTDGIGKQTALELAQQGATVLVHGRNPVRGEQVVDEIRRVTGNQRVTLVVADLSKMAEVRQLAERVQAQTPHLDVLLHNAGTMMKTRELTEDGFETTFAVNHLAPFLLTHLLLDPVKAATPSRIITVASTTHTQGRLEFDNLRWDKKFSTYAAYSRSKLANILFANELAERLQGTGVTSNSLHPGVIGTKMLRDHYNMDGDSVEAGAETSVYLATSPDVTTVTGQYFVRKKIAPVAPAVQDMQLQKRLWQVSSEVLGKWL
jgi:NAD(P)-dependent dehydrogenase (short-subunit alcohol dehydrogenase family)